MIGKGGGHAFAALSVGSRRVGKRKTLGATSPLGESTGRNLLQGVENGDEEQPRSATAGDHRLRRW
jgi:hypothetical protein